jgi:FMNH2-dependent dimethyl sulfone monooxygenase
MNDLFESYGEFADFSRCGFGVKPLQKPRSPIFVGGLAQAREGGVADRKYGMEGWIGIMDTLEAIATGRTTIERELAAARRTQDRQACVFYGMLCERTHERL